MKSYDLTRAGITPDPERMATERGAISKIIITKMCYQSPFNALATADWYFSIVVALRMGFLRRLGRVGSRYSQ